MTKSLKNTREYRWKKGISWSKLSNLAGITLYTITKIKSGTTPDPRIETIKKIVGILDISIGGLLSG